MQKFMNDPRNIVDDSVRGFVKNHSNLVAYTNNKRALKYIDAPIKGKVGIVTGGGSGHFPAFLGYIGKNMVDAVAIGGIFTTPLADEFYEAIKSADGGKGVVVLIGNYRIDIEHVNEAVRKCSAEGIDVRVVIVKDDIASSVPSERRGGTGEVIVWKMAGAAAALGWEIDEIERACKKVCERTRTIGIGLASCTIPETGSPNYVIEDGTMEIGVGHHGLSSMDTCKLRTADETADIMVDAILNDFDYKSGTEIMVLLSGLGATPQIELNVLFSRVYDRLMDKGLVISKSAVGNYFTSLDMMGATLTVAELDDELKELLNVQEKTPVLNFGFEI